MNIREHTVDYEGLTWPRVMHPIMRDLVLAKHWREPPYSQVKLSHDPGEYMLRAAAALFPPDVFTVSPWTEEHAHDFACETFVTTLGGASCSKSNDYGMMILLDFLTDPLDTIAILASTTVDMLALRSFESVTRYFRYLKKHPKFLIPCKESKVRMAIINDEDDLEDTDLVTTSKASIKGVAIRQGTESDARASLQGAHLPYVRYVIDELSALGSREGAMSARHNMSIGAKDFRFFGLANPESYDDLCCRHSVPIDGWASVDIDTSTYWRTRWGVCRRHDGLKSPGITEPEKYPYLLQQSQIDRILRENGGNMDAPEMYQMVRGFPPPQGSEQTVLTTRLVDQWAMKSPILWGPNVPTTRIAGLDPAFTSGGDAAVLQPATVGFEAVTNRLVIAFEPEIVIPLRASEARPIVYQVVDFVLDWANDQQFDLTYLGVDESGTQRLGDMIEVENIGRGGPSKSVCRVNFGASASAFPVSTRDTTESRKVYRNQVTELYYALREYGSFGQIRAMPDTAADQCCRRRVLLKHPKALEEKVKMKARIKRSPDQADALVCAIAVAKWVLRLSPGATQTVMRGTASKAGGFSRELLAQYDIDRADRTYQQSFI